MQPYQISILGLLLDIVGAFLVAVEAIKLENLRILRDRVLRRAHAYTLSPQITIVDSEGELLGPRPPSVPADRYPMLFIALHYVAGMIMILLLDYLSDGRVFNVLIRSIMWAFDRPWYITTVLLLLFFFFGGVGGLWILGELVHMSLTAGTRMSIRVLDAIDARTPDGTVGIFGFLLLFAGFVLQMLGTFLGSRGAS